MNLLITFGDWMSQQENLSFNVVLVAQKLNTIQSHDLHARNSLHRLIVSSRSRIVELNCIVLRECFPYTSNKLFSLNHVDYPIEDRRKICKCFKESINNWKHKSNISKRRPVFTWQHQTRESDARILSHFWSLEFLSEWKMKLFWLLNSFCFL